jgi:hypothetical protein
MIKTLLAFVVAAVGFIVVMDANAERIRCWRDYNGNVICETARKPQPRPTVPVNVPTPTFPN